MSSASYSSMAPRLVFQPEQESSGQPYCWNELVTLCTKYRDLTAHSQLALTVWDVSCGEDEGLVGGATILLFNSKTQLKTGKQKLRLWPGKEADGSYPTTTPGKVPRPDRGELERLDKLVNKYERGQIHHIDWLDRLTFKTIDKIKEKKRYSNGSSHLSLIVDFCSGRRNLGLLIVPLLNLVKLIRKYQLRSMSVLQA